MSRLLEQQWPDPEKEAELAERHRLLFRAVFLGLPIDEEASDAVSRVLAKMQRESMKRALVRKPKTA